MPLGSKRERKLVRHKVYAGVDIEKGLILAAHVTQANKADTGELGQVLRTRT
jgi:hypothetical protein